MLCLLAGCDARAKRDAYAKAPACDQALAFLDVAGEALVTPAPAVFPARLFTPTPKAAKRVFEFFTTQINNDHTRYALAIAALDIDPARLHSASRMSSTTPSS